jgi:hypothetical protein
MGVGVGEGVGRGGKGWEGVESGVEGCSKGGTRVEQGQSKSGGRAEQGWSKGGARAGKGRARGGEGQSKGGQGWGRVDGVLRHTFLGNQLPMIEVLTCPRRGQHA